MDELKPLLADPDKGLQTVLSDWERQMDLEEKGDSTYQGCEIKLRNCEGLSGTTVEEITIDNVLKNYTASQKKALILEAYFSQRMEYGKRCWYRAKRESDGRINRSLKHQKQDAM